MAFDVIKNIVEAETQAEQIKLSALQKVAAIKTEAAQKAEEIIKNAALKAKTDKEETVRKAVEECQSDVQGIIKEAEAKCAQTASVAGSRKDMAVKAVMRKVVGVNGDS